MTARGTLVPVLAAGTAQRTKPEILWTTLLEVQAKNECDVGPTRGIWRTLYPMVQYPQKPRVERLLSPGPAVLARPVNHLSPHPHPLKPQ